MRMTKTAALGNLEIMYVRERISKLFIDRITLKYPLYTPVTCVCMAFYLSVYQLQLTISTVGQKHPALFRLLVILVGCLSLFSFYLFSYPPLHHYLDPSIARHS